MNQAERALELLREHGWCKGVAKRGDGAMCISGALYEATGGVWGSSPWTVGHYEALKVMREQYPRENYIAFTSFNDDPERTFADVERVLEKVAMRLEEVA